MCIPAQRAHKISSTCRTIISRGLVHGTLGIHTQHAAAHAVITLRDSCNEAPLLIHRFRGQGDACVCSRVVCDCVFSCILWTRTVPWLKATCNKHPIEYIYIQSYGEKHVFFLSHLPFFSGGFHRGLSLFALCANTLIRSGLKDKNKSQNGKNSLLYGGV